MTLGNIAASACVLESGQRISIHAATVAQTESKFSKSEVAGVRDHYPPDDVTAARPSAASVSCPKIYHSTDDSFLSVNSNAGINVQTRVKHLRHFIGFFCSLSRASLISGKATHSKSSGSHLTSKLLTASTSSVVPLNE